MRPVSYLSSTSASPVETPTPPKGPKIKTQGQAQEPVALDAAPDVIEQPLSRPILVPRKVYETLEQMLVRADGPMDWVDIEKVFQ